MPKFRQGNGNKSEWNTKLTAQNIKGRYKEQQMQKRRKFEGRHFYLDDKALMWSCVKVPLQMRTEFSLNRGVEHH